MFGSKKATGEGISVPDGAGPASRGEALLGKVAGCCSGKCPKKGDISLGGLERQFYFMDLYGHIFYVFWIVLVHIWQVFSSCLQCQDQSERKFLYSSTNLMIVLICFLKSL